MFWHTNSPGWTTISRTEAILRMSVSVFRWPVADIEQPISLYGGKRGYMIYHAMAFKLFHIY